MRHLYIESSSFFHYAMLFYWFVMTNIIHILMMTMILTMTGRIVYCVCTIKQADYRYKSHNIKTHLLSNLAVYTEQSYIIAQCYQHGVTRRWLRITHYPRSRTATCQIALRASYRIAEGSTYCWEVRIHDIQRINIFFRTDSGIMREYYAAENENLCEDRRRARSFSFRFRRFFLNAFIVYARVAL